MASARQLRMTEKQGEGAAGGTAPSCAALPPDILRSIFQLVFSPAADSSRQPAAPAAGSSASDGAEEEAALPALPLRQAVRQWFALRLTCRPWAAALQGLPLPPLEVWAACPGCLAWLGRPEVGVQAVRFIRRAPLHTSVEPPGVGYPIRHHFCDWRRQHSVGAALSEWPRSPADEMLCRLEGVVPTGPGRASRQPLVAAPAAMWSFAGWAHLQELSMQAPSTADSRPTALQAPPSLCALSKLRILNLAGFADYELRGLPSTLRMLRLMQRQAGERAGVPDPVQLSNLVSGNLQLDSLSFELLPAAGEQLARQQGEQGAVDVSLLLLCQRCKRLEVVGPQVGLDCACSRCEASLAEDSEGSDSGTPAQEGGPSQPSGPDVDDERYYREALGHAAALLAAPGSLLRSVTLRSTAGELDEAAEPGLLLSRCTRHQYVYEFRSIWSIHALEAAIAALNAASSRQAASTAAAASEAEGTGGVSVSFESRGEIPTALMLHQR